MSPEDVAFYELAAGMSEADAIGFIAIGVRWLAWRTVVRGEVALTASGRGLMEACAPWLSAEGGAAKCMQAIVCDIAADRGFAPVTVEGM